MSQVRSMPASASPTDRELDTWLPRLCAQLNQINIETETDRIHAFLEYCKSSAPSDLSYDTDDMASSIDSTPHRPGRETEDWRHIVLHPRCILVGNEYCAPRVVKGIRLKAKDIDERALGRALVKFDAEKLTEFAKTSEFAKDNKYNEAQWTRIYHTFFLYSNLNFEGGVQGLPQFALYWDGLKANICLPPPADFDRRASGLPSCTKIWEVAPHQYGKKLSEHCAILDHVYCIVPGFQTEDLKAFRCLPGFRHGIHHKKRPISCPPYLITEDKSRSEFDTQAHNYLAFVGGSLLQDRLLLRYLTDEAQRTKEFAWDETLVVYLMAPCGEQVTISRMKVRQPNEDLKKKEKRVRFDLEKLCILDTTDRRDCDELRVWVNFIHNWGLEVHQPALLDEGRKACCSNYCTPTSTTQTSLAMVSFHYTTTGSISFSVSTFPCRYGMLYPQMAEYSASSPHRNRTHQR